MPLAPVPGFPHWQHDTSNAQWVRDDGVVVRATTIPSMEHAAVLGWEVDLPWAWVDNAYLPPEPLRPTLAQVDARWALPSWLRRPFIERPRTGL